MKRIISVLFFVSIACCLLAQSGGPEANTTGSTSTFNGGAITNDLTTTAKIGVGTSTPDCGFQNQGFSRLGSGSIKLACMLITGTTPSAGGATAVAHSLGSRIRWIDFRVTNSGGAYMPPNVPGSNLYYFYWDSSNVAIAVDAGGSSVADKTYDALVWYTE